MFDVTRGDEPDDEVDVSLPPFPTASFSLDRFPESGEVVAISSSGDLLQPELVIPWKHRIPDWASEALNSGSQSVLLNASFEELRGTGGTAS